ncbi:MAG TPA: ribonuclease HI family protein [Clostridia bacterium]|nr:ribonuclease HI family protein [Clostridia bacterium]
MDKLVIYADGGSRGNPGDAGIGVAIFDDNDELVAQISRYIGTQTNNVAEYYALIRGLEEAITLGAGRVDIFMDSELVVKQIKGEYQVKNEGLKPLYEIAKAYLGRFDGYSINHIGRNGNKLADKLANDGMDSKDSQIV